MKFSWKTKAIERLKHCFPDAPAQGAVGQAPRGYLGILDGEFSHALLDCDGGSAIPVSEAYPEVSGPVSRADIRRICTDPRIDVLEAYAAAMAWGGQHRRWFRASLGHAGALRALLCDLRASTRPRADDFAATQSAAASITGLNISFYTKLLFFFRPHPDAYILDQWTAKSIHLLTGDVVRLSPEGLEGLPATGTPREEYEAYCQSLEELGGLLGGWTGEQAERAVFDRPGGCWRTWLIKQIGDGESDAPLVGGSVSSAGQEDQTKQPENNSQEMNIDQNLEPMKIRDILIRKGEEGGVAVEPATSSQEDFEASLRDLLGWLKILGVKKLVLKSGGGLRVPDWFLDECRKLGIEIKFENGGAFKDFLRWLANLPKGTLIPTLGGRSGIGARYDPVKKELEITNSKGNDCIMDVSDIRRIFDRYFSLDEAERNRAVSYTDPEWPETPNRIFAPYVAALIKEWLKGRRSSPPAKS